MAAAEEADMGGGAALDGVAAGLALPFVGVEIGGGLGGGEAVEGDDAVHDTGAGAAVGGGEHHGGEHVVAAAGEEFQAGCGLFAGFGFGEDAAAAGDDGVGGEDVRPAGWAGGGFGAGEAERADAGEFGLAGGFVDFRGADFVRGQADLGQQVAAPEAGGCQDEAGPGFALGLRSGVDYLNRKVIRPLERS